jgi:hypothetical protein
MTERSGALERLPQPPGMVSGVSSLINRRNNSQLGLHGRIAMASGSNMYADIDSARMGHEQIPPLVHMGGSEWERQYFGPVLLAGAFTIAAAAERGYTPLDIPPADEVQLETFSKQIFTSYKEHSQIELSPATVLRLQDGAVPEVSEIQVESIQRLNMGLERLGLDAQYVSKVGLIASQWCVDVHHFSSDAA